MDDAPFCLEAGVRELFRVLHFEQGVGTEEEESLSEALSAASSTPRSSAAALSGKAVVKELLQALPGPQATLRHRQARLYNLLQQLPNKESLEQRRALRLVSVMAGRAPEDPLHSDSPLDLGPVAASTPDTDALPSMSFKTLSGKSAGTQGLTPDAPGPALQRIASLLGPRTTPHTGRPDASRTAAKGARAAKHFVEERTRALSDTVETKVDPLPEVSLGWEPPPITFRSADTIRGMGRREQNVWLAWDLLDALQGLPVHDVLLSRDSASVNPAYDPDLLHSAHNVAQVALHLQQIRRFADALGCAAFGNSVMALVCSAKKAADDKRWEALELQERIREVGPHGEGTVAAVEERAMEWAAGLRTLAERCLAEQRGRVLGGKVADVLRLDEAFGDARPLLRHAAKDVYDLFARQLDLWLAHGRLDDPFKEFFIARAPTRSPNDPLKLHDLSKLGDEYVVRRHLVPVEWVGEKAAEVLEAGVQRLILHKTLLRDREAGLGGEEEAYAPPPAFDEAEEGAMLRWITGRCRTASAAFLLFLRRQGLPGTLRAFHQLFTVRTADWLTAFLDNDLVQTELWKPRDQVNIFALQEQLRKALAPVLGGEDGGPQDEPFPLVVMEKIDIEEYLRGLSSMGPTSPTEVAPSRAEADGALKGWGALGLRLPVPFPLSRAFPSSLLTEYQLLLRRLLLVHQLLLRLGEAKRELSGAPQAALVLRYQLSEVLQAYLAHAQGLVLGPKLAAFQAKAEAAQELDALREAHAETMKDIFRDLLMTDEGLVAGLGAVFALARDFVVAAEQGAWEEEEVGAMGERLSAAVRSLQDAAQGLDSAAGLSGRLADNLGFLMQRFPFPHQSPDHPTPPHSY